MFEIIIALFDNRPRRPASVYNLLVGKKTLSTLYAALLHDQLQWVGLLPDLARSEFDDVIAAATRQGDLVTHQTGLTATRASTVTLPASYQPWMDIDGFAGRFYLAVQSLSEASFSNRQYRPVTPDWATQAWVRQWYRQLAQPQAIAELTALFAALPAPAANRLALGLVGHDYVGSGLSLTPAARLADIEAFSALLARLDAEPQRYPSWAQLWGGRHAILSATNAQALALAAQGANRVQIQAALRRKMSTVNEHLLVGAIFGAEFPLDAFYPPAQKRQFDAQALGDPEDYQQLLAAVPGSDFFQVRLFQILTLQGRWPQ
ncbi:hypothetical protein [Lacticaseibacillus nasuensis]|uniref:Helicase Helix-turn-helix domain-containing protein n=1 Tax=Lacticaseibacillus nasuensis JCM 17158 TaxID=1291734 RepID=A0A0R1JQE3_9LACO|nr:hypothetical protein [Lacticaseibacillus nasuensis]KRK73388.1 hypothetical protein FD02_GL001246 [Lacticaseibacillus nasuensis JCM 17158]